MITRLRNASLIKTKRVYVIQTGLSLSIAKILKENNYIESFISGFNFNKVPYICLVLKFDKKNNSLSSIISLKRVSRPGLRIYSKSGNLPKVLGGLGVSVFDFFLTVIILK